MVHTVYGLILIGVGAIMLGIAFLDMGREPEDDRDVEGELPATDETLVYVHEGATETWSPRTEHAEVQEASDDDTDLFLAELNRKFDALCSAPWDLDEELRKFIDDSQQLHAYRELRIGATQEIPRVVG